MAYQHIYTILKDLKINIQVYKGQVNLKAMMSSMKELVSDEDYKESNFGLVDFRDADLSFSEEELQSFIDFLHQQDITNVARKIALLTETPNQVVFTSIFSDLASHSIGIDYQIFSTAVSMFDFLEIPDGEREQISAVIESLNRHLE